MEPQDMEPSRPLYIERVGFRGVRRRVVIDSPLGPQHLDLELELYVDLYAYRRGVHLSRSIEALEYAMGGDRARSLESLLRGVAKGLLEKHPYASKAYAKAKTKYYVEVESAGVRGVEAIDAGVEVEMGSEGLEVWRVEVEARGFTVCPSAQASIGEMLGRPGEWAVPSHSQRVILRGRVSTRKVMVRIEDVAGALFSSFSAPSFTLLKRPWEARVIMEAFKRPMFAEDLVREAAYRISMIPSVTGDAEIEVEAVSLETIHPHDLYAYLKVRAEEARRFGGGGLRKGG